MGRAEACDLFRKWFTDRVLLRCDGRFAIHAFFLRVRVLSVQDYEIRFMADDTNSELIFKITDAIRFGYLDSRQVEGRESAEYKCAIVAVIGDPRNDPDSITFGEILTMES
jgi:hypothetical protein